MTPVKIYSTAGVEGDGLTLTISSRVSGVDNTYNPPVCPIFLGFAGFGYKNTPSRQSYQLDFYATVYSHFI